MDLKLFAVIAVAVLVSGCTSSGSSQASSAELIGKVSDGMISDDDPGEITLNARNYGDKASFHVKIEPVGDYRNLIKVTDRQGKTARRVNLGGAVKEATTGEQFAHVRKKLNVSSTVRLKAELYNSTGSQPLDAETYTLKLEEEN